MKTMVTARSLLLGTVSLGITLMGADLGGVGAARAATETYNITTGVHTTELSASHFGGLEFPLFNSSLGLLSSVAVTVTGTLSGTGSGVNNTSTVQTLDYAKTSKIFLSSADLTQLVSSVGALAGHALVVTTATQGFTVAAHGAISIGPVIGSNAANFTYNSALVLNQFERAGGGSTGLTVATVTKDKLTETGGAFSVSVASTADVSFSVVYSYTPESHSEVPEPTTVMLLGTGLAGLGIVRRRSWQQAAATILDRIRRRPRAGG